ncbi:MAG: ABC transporter ATP-binding protein [Anaerolineae bacterium]|jgi:ATP-binding cassette subfamily B protein
MNIPLRQYWNLLADHIKPQKGRFALLTVLLLGSIVLQIANPQIVRAFIDGVTSGEPTGMLTASALAFIGIALLQQVIGVGATYVGENVAWTATNALRADLLRHCLRLDMGFHNDTTPGALIERIDGDVAEMANFFSRLVIQVVGNLLLLIGVVVALLLTDRRVGLAFALFALISLLVLSRIRGIAVPHVKARRQARADLFGFLEEQLAGTEDVRSSGAVDFVLRELYRLQYAILGHDRKTHLKRMTIGLVSGGVLVVGNVLAVVAGYYLFTAGAITVGSVYLIIQYVNLLSHPIRELTRQVEDLQTVGASVQRLTELRGVERVVQDGPGASLPGGALSLAFDGVSFAYAEDEPVLRDLSFRLEPGTVLGLLGRTGSGKTTIARLVFRLYDPSTGKIALGGVDARQAKLRHLRQRVSIVTQDVQLFQASVRDNLTFFDRSIPDERILAVVEDLELTDWYRALPEGLNTRLEGGGRDLSAGEAQLLAFARVFLRDPGLVILDEASSRLDPATERRVERAVDKLLQDRTAIVIAHRLGTVHRADDIMILETGRVVEHGERERLAGDPSSRFYNLLQTGLEEVLA